MILVYFIFGYVALAAPESNILLYEYTRSSPQKLTPYLIQAPPNTQIRALQALGNLRNKNALPILKQIQTFYNKDIRLAYSQALMLTPGSANLINEQLRQETDPQVKANLFLGIGKQGNEQHLQILHNTLTLQNPFTDATMTIAAATAIGLLARRNIATPEESIPILLGQLQSWNAEVRQAAAFSLVSLMPNGTTSQSNEQVTLPSSQQEKLLRATVQDPDPHTRAMLIGATNQLFVSESYLQKWFSDPSPFVRMAALKRDPRNELSKDLLQDKNLHVRLKAIEWLTRSGALFSRIISKGSTIEAQENAILNGSPHFAEAIVAIRSLSPGRLNPSSFMQEKSPTQIRIAALSLLTSTQLLEYALQDQEIMVQIAATRELLSRKMAQPSNLQATLKDLLKSHIDQVVMVTAQKLSLHPNPNIEKELWGALQKTKDKRTALSILHAIAALKKGKVAKSKVQNYLQPWLNKKDPSFRIPLLKIMKRRNLSTNSIASHNYTSLPKDLLQIQGALLKTRYGTIRIQLFPEKAPLSVANFARLVEEGFYNGQKFHRIIPDFVIQGGAGTYGDPGWQIPDELSTKPFNRGAVGLANRGRDTGGSQFFIVLSPQPHLVGEYSLFGHITHGMQYLNNMRPFDRIESIQLERRVR